MTLTKPHPHFFHCHIPSFSSFTTKEMPSSKSRVIFFFTPNLMNTFFTLFFFYYYYFFISCIKAQQSEWHINDQEADRIIILPGQPSTPSISQFSGYIKVNSEPGRALFYWFFEAQSRSSERPILLWLNGGPGCSSIGYGAAVELGPLKVKRDGKGLEFNRYAWNKEANLLFLESPVGVGFSYTNSSSDLLRLDDDFVAQDAYNFTVNWLRRFPQYQNHEFYISGESYAGHYVPQLAESIYDHNQNTNNLYINLKGFIVGNPETDDFYDSKGLLEYAWSHSVISDQVYKLVERVCDFKIFDWTHECDSAMNLVFDQYNLIDIYNIYSPKCNLAQPSSTLNSEETKRRRIRTYSGYDPCFSKYAEDYFNNFDVQRSLHASLARKNGRWKVCSDPIFKTYNFTVPSVLPIYSKLIKAGLRIWFYSGDTDGRLPVIGSRYCAEFLNLPLRAPWQPWFLHHQVAGRFVEYEGLTMMTVRGAGHLVPLNKPEEALVLINTYLSNQQLPTHY